MNPDMKVTAFNKEHVDAYSQWIAFDVNGREYELTLHWSTYDGYDLVFHNGDWDLLAEEMGEEAFDDLASPVELMVMESNLEPR